MGVRNQFAGVSRRVGVHKTRAYSPFAMLCSRVVQGCRLMSEDRMNRIDNGKPKLRILLGFLLFFGAASAVPASPTLH
jgi:hypothetical protein